MATRRFGEIGTGQLDNLEAIIPPAATDDVGLGYKVGSVWYDTVLDDWYVCVDEADDNAVWIVTGVGVLTPSAEDWSGNQANVTPDRVIDANTTTIDEFADVLGTLIADLVTTGIIA